MEVTFIEGHARGPSAKHEVASFLADNGAGYFLLRHGVWQSLCLEPTRGEICVG